MLFCYHYPANIYLFKVAVESVWNMFKANNEITRTMSLTSGYKKRNQPRFTCSKLTIETLVQSVKYVQRHYFTPCASVTVVNYEHEIADWVTKAMK